MARILVIDDEALIRMVIRQLLESAGYEVREAGNGEEGVQFCRQSPPELVAVDIQMPGKSGLDVIRELHRGFPGIKIIAMADYRSSILSTIKKLRVDYTFVKPFSMQEFLEVVEELLGKGR